MVKIVMLRATQQGQLLYPDKKKKIQNFVQSSYYNLYLISNYRDGYALGYVSMGGYVSMAFGVNKGTTWCS